MGEPATSAPGPANPVEQRRCRKCEQTKAVAPETWLYRKGRTGTYQAHGLVCLECEKKRKAAYEAQRDKIAASVASMAAPDPEGKPEDARKAVAAASKLDIAHALKAGSKVLNEYAPSVMARILEYLEDPEHEHHLWALELLAQRILPRKLYEELGGVAAGVGSLNDKRPQFTINILPAVPSEPQGRLLNEQDGAHVQIDQSKERA